MGTWGASVTASDTAQELMDEYSAAFSYYDVPTALEKLEQYVTITPIKNAMPFEAEWRAVEAEFAWCIVQR